MNNDPGEAGVASQPPVENNRPWLRWNWKEASGLLVVSVVFVFLVFRGVDPEKSAFLDLNPHPDCVEYAVMASRIYHGLGADLSINGFDFPGRYPVGFPLVLALLHPFFAGSTPAVIVCAPILFMLASVWIFFALLRRYEGSRAAWMGTILYAGNPCTLILAEGLYSESLLALLTVLCAGFFLATAEGGRSHHALLSGIFFGFSILVRTQVVITIPVFLVAWFYLRKQRPGIRPLLFALCGMMPFLLALAFMQWRQFGSPFSTGYNYHLHDLGLKLLSLAYFPGDFSVYASGLFVGQSMPGPSIRMPFIPIALTLLALAGIADAWRKGNRRAVFLSLLFAGTVFTFFCCYLFRDVRFFIQVLLLYFAWAGIGAAWIAGKLPHRWHFPVLAGIVAIVLAAPAGTRKTPAAFAVLTREKPQQSRLFLSFRQIDLALHRAGASRSHPVLFTAENLALLDFYTDEILLYPLSKKQEYARVSHIRPAFPGTIDAFLQKKNPVYVTDMDEAEENDVVAFREIAEDFEMTPVPCPMGGEARLYRIVQRKKTAPGRSYWGG